MPLFKAHTGVLLAAALGAPLSGCAVNGAPSFVLFGAYFPAWMLLAGIGIVIALATRVALVATGLAAVLPLQLFVCTSTGLIVASLTWLLWFAT
jgi:hypothetical protein